MGFSPLMPRRSFALGSLRSWLCEEEIMSFAEYANYDGVGLAALVHKGEVSPAELVEAAIERIGQVVDDVFFPSLDSVAAASVMMTVVCHHLVSAVFRCHAVSGHDGGMWPHFRLWRRRPAHNS